MTKHVDPNSAADAPVKKEIFMVLGGFIVMTAVIAIVVNMAV